MTKRPDTISDAEWARLQKGAAKATGGLIKTDEQQRRTDTWSTQRDRAKHN